VKRDLRWRVHLTVPPAQAYGWIATDAGRARWWVARSAEADGLVELQLAEGETLIAPVLERHPPGRFALRWLGGSEARFELRPDGGGGCDLEFTLLDVPDERWAREHGGWAARLMVLKAACAFGVDLRNHDPQRGFEAGYLDG
jgi:uncharacterized protein YndB with AHSA1/START domain